MNAKIPVFVICIEAITYLLLYNLHDSTFNCVKEISRRFDLANGKYLSNMKNRNFT